MTPFAVLRAVQAGLDAHPGAVHAVAAVVVLSSFAFVAWCWVADRRARSAERFRAKFLRPADVRVERARRRA